MSNRLAVIANSVLALLILATLIFAFPFMSSAFYLYRSKENLDRAFQAQGLDPDAWDINKAITESPPPLGDSVKISLAQAIDNLHSAIRWDKRNEQAYRFLLQAYVLQQDFSDASDVAVGFGKLYPGDRNVHFTLGNIHAKGGNLARAVEAWAVAGTVLPLDRQGEWNVQQSVHIEAADFRTGKSGGAKVEVVDQKRVMEIYPTGSIDKLLFFPEVGEYRIKVRAQTGIPSPIRLDVTFDDQPVAKVVYAAGDQSWTDQETRIRVGWGLHWLGIRFASDFSSPSVTRNALVEFIEVSRIQ